MPRYLIHTASIANTRGHRTFIDEPLINGRESAVLLITPFYGPGNHDTEPEVAEVLNPNQTGVQYHRARQRWSILNLNGAPMPPGARFSVVYESAPSLDLFTCRTTPDSVSGDYAVIQFPSSSFAFLQSDKRRLILFVTPRVPPLDIDEGPALIGIPPMEVGIAKLNISTESLDPRLRAGIRPVGPSWYNHPIGVWYNQFWMTWVIVNMDSAAMSPWLTYNVADFTVHPSGPEHVGVCVTTGDMGNFQLFCLAPCEAAGVTGTFGFLATVNLSYPNFYRSRGAPLGCGPLLSEPRRCRHPFAIGAARKRTPVPFQPGLTEQRTYIMFQDNTAIPARIGFNVVHILTNEMT